MTFRDIERIILYEDNHFLVVNKPAGILVQGDRTNDETLPDYVKEFIRLRDEKPGNVFLGVTHRLDRPSTGVLVFAKTSKALSRMNELFRERKVKKTYYILTENAPDSFSGRLEHFVRKDEAKNRLIVKDVPFKKAKKAKKAVLEYQLVANIDGFFLFEVQLHTGRSHQIRAQFAHVGCPVVGDRRYGSRFQSGERLYLHSGQIFFEHPVKRTPLRIRAPFPKGGRWDLFWDFKLEQKRE